MTDESLHSVFGPSSAHRWLECPGSIAAEAAMPPQPSSPYAEEGSAAHKSAETCLRGGIDCNDPDIMAYVNYVRSLGGFQEYEQRVSYEDWVPGGFGTADAIVVTDHDLHVIDFKFGKGVSVDAADNPQGMLYALGAMSERDSFQSFEKIIITIHQPRIDHISTWETTPNTIYHWAEWWVKPRAALSLKPDAPRIPGLKQCRWCAASAVCPERLKSAEDALMTQFHDMTAEDDKSLPAIEQLSDKQLRMALENKAAIIHWLSAVEDHVMARILNGEKFDGFKIVRGRSNRKWVDEVAAEKKLVELLGDQSYTKKILTAPAAEKALGKARSKEIFDFIIKPEGAPTLVPDTDRRKEVTEKSITADDFDF